MSYQEKQAWVVFVPMVIAYTLYFGLLIGGHPAATDRFAMLWLFGSIAGTQGLIVLAAMTWLWWQARKSPRPRTDERDRAIAARASTMAYGVLLTAMLLVGVVMPFTEPPMKIINTALLGVVLAETVRSLVILISYRRGWHG